MHRKYHKSERFPKMIPAGKVRTLMSHNIFALFCAKGRRKINYRAENSENKRRINRIADKCVISVMLKRRTEFYLSFESDKADRRIYQNKYCSEQPYQRNYVNRVCRRTAHRNGNALKEALIQIAVCSAIYRRYSGINIRSEIVYRIINRLGARNKTENAFK